MTKTTADDPANNEKTNFGTFTKDGETRVAGSVAEAVKLRFDGWLPTK